MDKKVAIVVALAILLPTLGRTCLNDRDSIERIASKDAIDACIGWFDRNPPEYFQARINWLVEKQKSTQLTASEYDNISVAYDRVGNDDEAIRLIKEKFDLMNRHGFKEAYQVTEDNDASDPYGDLSDEDYHRYSTQANWGTFLYHRWIKAGEPQNRVSEAQEAIDHIDQAVKINPEAHSGREWVQRDLMAWMIDRSQGKNSRFPNFGKKDQKEVVDGLAGLVMLGGAWQSLDVFALISQEATYSEGLQDLAYLRAKELQDGGARSLTGLSLQEPPKLQQKYIDYFNMVRKKADQNAQDRADFIKVQLAQGKMPDRNPHMLDGYQSKSRPAMVDPEIVARQNWDMTSKQLMAIPIALIFAVPFAYAVIKSMRLSREAKRRGV